MINHVPQINVYKNLKYSKKICEAGEDGYLKINGEILECATDNQGFLANIEDVDEFSNGDIIVATTDGDFTLYIFNKVKNTYEIKKLQIKITDDCIYHIKTKELTGSVRSFECQGEKGVVYNFIID